MHRKVCVFGFIQSSRCIASILKWSVQDWARILPRTLLFSQKFMRGEGKKGRMMMLMKVQ